MKANKRQQLSSFEQDILAEIKAGKGIQNVLAPLIKRVIEAALEGELDAHLEQETGDKNYRNGKSCKTIKSSVGEFELATPRERNGNFEPQIIQKIQTVMTDDLDVKILNLYANGMSYSDIQNNLEEIYQVPISSGAIIKITDKLLPELEECQPCGT